MNKCLLDTDILSEIIKGRDLVVAAKAHAYLAQLGRFTTSAVSVAEIIYGFRRIGREDRVAQFEASLTNAHGRTDRRRDSELTMLAPLWIPHASPAGSLLYGSRYCVRGLRHDLHGRRLVRRSRRAPTGREDAAALIRNELRSEVRQLLTEASPNARGIVDLAR